MERRALNHQERYRTHTGFLDHITGLKRLYHWFDVTRRLFNTFDASQPPSRCASSSRSAPKHSTLERILRSRFADRSDQGNFSPTQRPLNECRKKTDRKRKREKREGANALLLLMDVVVRGWHGGTKCLRESRLVKTQMNVREKTIASSYFSRSPSSFFFLPFLLLFCLFLPANWSYNLLQVDVTDST